MRFFPRALLIAFFVAAFTLVSPVFAHTTSVTHIDVKVDRESLVVTLGLHQADLLEHVVGVTREKFADREELEDTAPRVLTYVLAHFLVEADGKSITGRAENWPAQHAELTRTDEKGIQGPSLVPMQLRYALPTGTRGVAIKPDLFTAMNFAAVFDVAVYREGVKPLTFVVDNHQPIKFDLPTTGAVAAIASETNEETSPGFFATLLRFLAMGFHHIVPAGLDHILFVLGLYFLSPKIKDLFWQVTAFTVAHSITLGLAAFNVFTLPSGFVEPMIALSIVAVAVENLFSRNKPVRPWRWALVFVFGLVHGMGFADILHETHLPTGQVVTAILSFNVGVEGGQIAVLLAAMALTRWWQKREWYFRYIAAPASVMIACTGTFWAVQRIFEL